VKDTGNSCQRAKKKLLALTGSIGDDLVINIKHDIQAGNLLPIGRILLQKFIR
jgi:hypothetical protein